MNYTAQQYIDDVLTSEQIACKWVKLAAKRHVKDLKRQKTKSFPFYFEDTDPKRVIDFSRQFCKHVRGEWANRGEVVELSPWEQFIVWVIFGWKKVSNGKRRFSTAFIEVAKKNGKSTLAAVISLYLFGFDGEQGAEVYSAAITRDQARIVFDDYAKKMVIKSEELQKVITPYRDTMIIKESMSKFSPVSSEANNAEGKNVYVAIIDEYHAHSTDKVYKILRYGMSGRNQPLLFLITTAGFDPYVPCVDEEEYAKSLLSGKQKNENYFAIIFTLDEKDDWKNKKCWIKANPELGRGKPLDQMEIDFNEAIGKPQEINMFKNKHLNIWTSSQTAWLKSETWKKCDKKFNIEEMAGSPCYAGIDLSTTQDASAYGLCFPWEDRYRLIVKIFLPEYNLEERIKLEKVPWQQWVDNGHVILTPGNTIDYDFIQAEVMRDWETYDLREVAYDPHNAAQFIINLNKEGLEDNLSVFPQSWQYMNTATKDFEIKVRNEQLEVYPNDCLDWMIECTEVRTDSNGNYRPVKPDKRKARKHIDGVIASLLAVGTAIKDTMTDSVYENRGVIVV